MMLRSIGRAVGKCHRFSGMYSKNMHRNMQTIAISSQSDIPSRHSLSWSVLAGALILTAGCVSQNESHCASEGNIFTKAEISKHTTKEVGIWVTYGDGISNDYLHDVSVIFVCF